MDKGVRIVWKERERAALEEFVPVCPKENEARIRITTTLISSGTEKAQLRGGPNTFDRYPQYPGYSGVGVIEETGSKVSKFKQGDRVFVSYGGHASHSIVNENRLVMIPDAVSDEEACFTRIVSFPLLALRRSRLEMGESVVVIGLGMLGLFGVQLARLAGGTPVIAIGNRDIRREKAALFGADHVFATETENLKDRIYELTKVTGDGGADVVLETSGSVKGIVDGIKLCAKGGRFLVNGCNRIMDQPVDFYRYVHGKGVSIIGAHDNTHPKADSSPGNWTENRDYRAILAWMADGRINAKDMIGEVAKYSEAEKVYERLLTDREFPLGVLFDWRDL